MPTESCTIQKMNIIVIGLPGSGKGTQSRKLAEHYNLKHVVSGDVLRQEAKKDTQFAKELRDLMKSGRLFPDELVNKVFLEHVPEYNYILDGYPRKLSQTSTLNDIDLVLFIEVSEDEAIRRILHRNEGRSDDNAESIRKRLQVFKEETEPVINFYKEKGVLEVVDGNGNEEEIFGKIKEIIFKRFNL